MVSICKECQTTESTSVGTIWAECQICGQVNDCKIINTEEDFDEEEFQKELRCTD